MMWWQRAYSGQQVARLPGSLCYKLDRAISDGHPDVGQTCTIRAVTMEDDLPCADGVVITLVESDENMLYCPRCFRPVDPAQDRIHDLKERIKNPPPEEVIELVNEHLEELIEELDRLWHG